MKKKLNKIAAAALTMAMAATMAVPTFAADVDPDNCDHSWDFAVVESDHLHETCSICDATRDVAFTKDPSTCTHEEATCFNYVPSGCTTEGHSEDTICPECGTVLEEGEVTPADGHIQAADGSGVIKETLATCEEEGELTAKCLVCGEEFTKKTPALGHQWDNETITKEPTTTEEGEKTYTCNRCGKTKTEVIPKLPSTEEPDQPSTDKKDDTKPSEPSTDKKDDTKPSEPSTDKKDDTKPAEPSTDKKEDTKPAEPSTDKKNDTTPAEPSTSKKDDTTPAKPTTPSTEKKDNTAPSKPAALKVGAKFKVSGQQYKVTAKSEVSFIAAKANSKTLSIPGTVKAKGVTYKVTSIAAKAVKDNKKLKSVTVGANVKKIANNAFYKCPALKTVTIKTTKLTKKTVSKKAFKSVNKKLVVKVPKKVKKSYTKIFKGLKIK